jgi:hypothetical protein
MGCGTSTQVVPAAPKIVIAETRSAPSLKGGSGTTREGVGSPRLDSSKLRQDSVVQQGGALVGGGSRKTSNEIETPLNKNVKRRTSR